MSHGNAALPPRARLKVAQLVVDRGVPVREVAARFQVRGPPSNDGPPVTQTASR